MNNEHIYIFIYGDFFILPEETQIKKSIRIGNRLIIVP